MFILKIDIGYILYAKNDNNYNYKINGEKYIFGYESILIRTLSHKYFRLNFHYIGQWLWIYIVIKILYADMVNFISQLYIMIRKAEPF